MKSLGVGPSGPQNLTRSPRCPTLHLQLQGFSMVFCCVRAQCMCAWHERGITPWLALWCIWNVSEEKEPTERPKFSKVAFTPNIHLACPRMSQMYLGFSEISNIIDWMGLQLARAAGVVPPNLKSLQSFQHPEPSRTWCHAVVGQAGVFNQRLCNNKIGIL